MKDKLNSRNCPVGILRQKLTFLVSTPATVQFQNRQKQTKMAKTEGGSVKKEDGRKNNAPTANLPRVPDHLKKPPYVPTGKPRGRRPGQKNKKTMRAEQQRLVNAQRQAAKKSE